MPHGPRDRDWLETVLADTDTLLRDHAHCERKAAATAMALVARHGEHPSLVAAMAELAREEIAHFIEVHEHIVARGGELGPDRGDPYAKALVDQVRGSRQERLVDRLLVSALIETRSFQRLKLLAEHHPEPELAEMFDRLARAEANHGHQFVSLARELGASRAEVDARLAELQAFEAELVASSEIRCAMH